MTSDSDLYDVLKASTSDEAPPARPSTFSSDDRMLLTVIVGTLYRTVTEVDDEHRRLGARCTVQSARRTERRRAARLAALAAS